MTAVDTNVLLDIVDGSPREAAAAIASLQASVPPLVVSAAVFAELCAHRGWSVADVRAFLAGGAIAIAWDLTETAWSAAGTAFGTYAERRRRTTRDQPRRIATDFLIGAHAETLGTLVTRDGDFYVRNFPDLRVVSPTPA